MSVLSRGFLSRGFASAARHAASHPRRTLALTALVVAGALALAATRLEVRTSNLDLIDPDLPEVERFLAFGDAFGTPNVLVVVLETTGSSGDQEPAQILSRAVRRIGPGLRGLNTARAVIDRLDEDAETLADLGFDETDELLLSFDQRMAFVFVQPAESDNRIETLEPVIRDVRKVLADAQLETLGVSAGLTGLPQYALDDRDVIRGDISRLSILSLVAIAVVFAVGFHELRRPGLGVVAVLVAVAVTAGLVSFVPGHLTLLSAFFAAILFGLGIDFGIHLITRTEDRVAAGETERDAVAGAAGDLAPALATTAATTAAVFFSMEWSGFRGFAELGVIAGLGILVCLAATVIVLPALLAATSKRARARPERTFLERLLPRLQSPLLAGLLGLAALAALLVGGPGFDADYLALQPRDSEAVRLERAMVERSDLSPQFAAFVVSTEDEARSLVDRMLDDDTVGEVRAITDLDDLLDADGEPLEIPEAWRKALVSNDGRYAVYAYPEGDVWNPSERDAFLEHMRAIDPAVTGMPFLGELMVDRSRRAMTRTALIGGFIVLLAVFLDLRRPSLVLLAVAPTALTLIGLHALMRLLGVAWNPIDVMALPVILGIAVDDGVHLVHRFLQEDGDLERTLAGGGRAVVLTSLTTLAAFGSLVLTDHRGLASFALVTVLGVACSLVLSLFLLPTALSVARRGGRARAALAVGGLFLLSLAPARSAAAEPPAALLDGSNDVVVHSAFVPSERNVHGEARLIRRGDAWVFQTILQSPQLRRGIQRMTKKELYAWPESEPGHEDSERYLVDLETAEDHALAAFEQREDPSQRAQQMLIELILSPTHAAWAFYEIDTGHEGSELVVLEKEPIVIREASRAYLRRAFQLQAESAFDGAVPELAELPP